MTEEKPRLKTKTFKIKVPKQPYGEKAMESPVEQEQYRQALDTALGDTLYVLSLISAQNSRVGRKAYLGSFDPVLFQPVDLSGGYYPSPSSSSRHRKGSPQSTRQP